MFDGQYKGCLILYFTKGGCVLKDFQAWVIQFYEKRQWLQYDSFQRMGYLMEETGELAQAIRAYELGRDRPDEAIRQPEELRQEILREMGDILSNLAILADRYGFTLEDAAEAHRDKLNKRFADTQA